MPKLHKTDAVLDTINRLTEATRTAQKIATALVRDSGAYSASDSHSTIVFNESLGYYLEAVVEIQRLHNMGDMLVANGYIEMPFKEWVSMKYKVLRRSRINPEVFNLDVHKRIVDGITKSVA